jgi:hypothetical protein
MFNKAKVARDAFTISLGGMTTIASFFPAPAIAHDRINKILDEQQAAARENRDRGPQSWVGEGRPVAQADCA